MKAERAPKKQFDVVLTLTHIEATYLRIILSRFSYAKKKVFLRECDEGIAFLEENPNILDKSSAIWNALNQVLLTGKEECTI